MDEIARYKHCFVCGEQNPQGLKARFFYDGTQATTEITATDEYEGYQGIYHGGVLSALLDEVMIKALLAQDILAVTAELTVKFKRPVRTGDRVRFAGRVVSAKGRLYLTEGEALADDDTPYATATAKYLEARPDLKEELNRSLD